MKITYIHHSSFLIELETMTLLFDYTEGVLPEIRRDKPLLVFASHRHGDHYSEKVLDLIREYKGIRYIFSDDIWRSGLPAEILGDITSMKPGQEQKFWFENEGVLENPLKDKEADIQVVTYRSTDEGVAFLIKAEGKTLYHAGDLNNWYWEGEPADWNANMAKDYSAEIDKMKGMEIDVAFLPLDPRQEEAFCLGLDEFMRKVCVSHVFPMHLWGDFSVIAKLKEMEISAPYRERIEDIQKDGDCYLVD